MEYRQLPKEEYYRLRPILEAENAIDAFPDDPRLPMTVIVAEEKGEIVAFGWLKLTPFVAEWVHPDHRGAGLLWAKIAGLLSGGLDGSEAYVVADNPVAEKLCEAIGLEKVTSPVYMQRAKRVKAEGA